ncbi:unnamed protein product [Meloidogyne enterolobii]|uniref:Uncharacterized protein n=1 Tax=Meloidogyne enterolobii TaxID=390850 RepID=A0ACB1B467_MELEN
MTLATKWPATRWACDKVACDKVVATRWSRQGGPRQGGPYPQFNCCCIFYVDISYNYVIIYIILSNFIWSRQLSCSFVQNFIFIFLLFYFNLYLFSRMSKDRPYCKALYDFRSEYPGELNFTANELIYIDKKINEEWLSGESQKSGQKGIFPISFVEIILNEQEVSV